MGVRHEARIAVIQFLYQQDVYSGNTLNESLELFHKIRSISPAASRFFQEIVIDLIPKISIIDKILIQQIDNFSFERLSIVDKNILRLATYELFFYSQIPVAVVINEAIEIAKKYGTVDSGRFVNGILDSIYKKFTHLKEKFFNEDKMPIQNFPPQ